MLSRALRSVAFQTRPVEVITVVNDVMRRGSAWTRNFALKSVQTRWVAFLDSDDEWLVNHVETLLTHATSDVDVIYTGCRVIGPDGREIPLQDEWGRFGQSFDADLMRATSYIPVTSLVRVDFAQRAYFHTPGETDYDDWGFYLNLLDAGARFLHVPKITWVWHHHGHNTSGRPDRGDAT